MNKKEFFKKFKMIYNWKIICDICNKKNNELLKLDSNIWFQYGYICNNCFYKNEIGGEND